MTRALGRFVVGVVALTLCHALPGPAPAQSPVAPAIRPLYVISDTHFGVGRAGGMAVHPMEDFRWPRAFEAFLRKIAAQNPDGVDLLIAGDFLELWQHPTVLCANSADEECGCTLPQMLEIVKDVLDAHRAELASLGDFLANPRNRVVVMPGNHDAALTDDMVWALVAGRIQQGRDRFIRVPDGVFLSADGRIAVEHGHQPAFDVNAFPDWPHGVVKACADGPRFFRPWGENFVQSLYNEVEVNLPLIDNMVPDSEGRALYERYSAQRRTTLADLARFIEFNLLQTSFYQKLQALDLSKPGESLTREKVQQCRRCLGADIFIIGNPLAQAVLSRGGAEASNFLEALRDRARGLGDNEARVLCERAVLMSPNAQLPLGVGGSSEVVCQGSLATAARALFDPDGSGALRTRVADLYRRSQKRLSLYVFGHTHEAKLAMPVEMPDGLTIDALNTGAFQRLMARPFFEGKKFQGESDIDALRRLRHDDLAACYSLVKISYKGRRPEAEVKQWFMEETEPDGRFLDDCDPTCSAPPGNCAKKKR